MEANTILCLLQKRLAAGMIAYRESQRAIGLVANAESWAAGILSFFDGICSHGGIGVRLCTRKNVRTAQIRRASHALKPRPWHKLNTEHYRSILATQRDDWIVESPIHLRYSSPSRPTETISLTRNGTNNQGVSTLLPVLPRGAGIPDGDTDTDLAIQNIPMRVTGVFGRQLPCLFLWSDASTQCPDAFAIAKINTSLCRGGLSDTDRAGDLSVEQQWLGPASARSAI